jgi:hypothetical protein
VYCQAEAYERVRFSFLQEATGVGTVFIASALGFEGVWEDGSRRADSQGGRDEYGPYNGLFSSTHDNELLQEG